MFYQNLSFDSSPPFRLLRHRSIVVAMCYSNPSLLSLELMPLLLRREPKVKEDAAAAAEAKGKRIQFLHLFSPFPGDFFPLSSLIWFLLGRRNFLEDTTTATEAEGAKLFPGFQPISFFYPPSSSMAAAAATGREKGGKSRVATLN